MSSNSQSASDFDENFFSSIAVPKTKDYSRLSSSPSRDQPCDSSYFEKHYPNLECDTPVKMRLPTASRESGDALPCPSMDNFLSSSSASENTTVQGDQRESGETSKVAQPTASSAPPVAQVREPFKIVPDVTGKAASHGENELIEGIEKLTMFAPKAPEERLSQRRRSEQKKKEEEAIKRRSAINATSTTTASRVRSVSSKRSVSREPSVRAPPVPRSRHNSVTRTISAPIAPVTSTGVVTRSMAAARAAETITTKPFVRRSVMPLKVSQKTPVAAAKEISVVSGDRSRDRTRRNNTTGSTLSARRSVLTGAKPVGATTPVAPPRRSASVNKSSVSASKAVPTNRPIAHANRSSNLRMSAIKPTHPPATASAEKAAVSRAPLVQPGGNIRNRVPLRVNPVTPVAKKTTAPVSGQRQTVRQPPVLTRSQSVERGNAQKQPVTAGTPRQSIPKGSRDDVFARLSTPKTSATPSRVSSDGNAGSIRKSAVRPVPSYVHSVTKNGLPSAGGLHGIRAPSKERSKQ